jgi:peptidoglycan/LPS O-acetylase OafA/YrhL
MVVKRINFESDASGLLDFMRFISAFTVMALHTTSNHLIPGYQAVMVFFVMSGYFIGSGVLRNISTRCWSWRSYLTNRLTRLWVVLIPALFLTIVWVTLQAYIFGTNSTHGNISWGTFLGNLFFLQGAHISVFGSNGPLWSLSYEFWYYMLFPVCVLGFMSRDKKQRILYSFLTLFLALFIYEVLGVRILEYFLIWLFGAAISLVRPLNIQSSVKKKSIYFIVVLTALASLWVPDAIIHHTPGYVSEEPYMPDVIVGLCFSALIYLTISFFNKSKRLHQISQAFKYLAGFSYTLYLIHYPVLNFIDAWQKADPNSPLNSDNPILLNGAYFLLFIVFLLYAWLISLFTEKKTSVIRKKVKQKLAINQRVTKDNKVYYES